MTNIVEIIDLLNKEGYHIDAVITEGKICIAYQSDMYDISTMSFSNQIRLIAYLINKEFFNM